MKYLTVVLILLSGCADDAPVPHPVALACVVGYRECPKSQAPRGWDYFKGDDGSTLYLSRTSPDVCVIKNPKVSCDN